ncbi:MAG: hypothetical protein V7K41_00760 [Nostoc sp.]|uniref:hypothetical protein n=1 Tax=Nostoc sp. TaxID=1180 RepID=UPI002FF5E927
MPTEFWILRVEGVAIACSKEDDSTWISFRDVVSHRFNDGRLYSQIHLTTQGQLRQHQISFI